MPTQCTAQPHLSASAWSCWHASAATPQPGDLHRGCRCFAGLQLCLHLMFFAFVSNNWRASAEAEPHPDWPGNGLASGEVEERIGRGCRR